ncbi:MAG: response regulator transcription factor [Angelakisella sp.]|nr:response regulator transcription factor [Angelakisella sp.]
MKCISLPAEQELAARRMVSDCLRREGFDDLQSQKLLDKCACDQYFVVATISVQLVSAEMLRRMPGALSSSLGLNSSNDDHHLVLAAPAGGLKRGLLQDTTQELTFGGLKLCPGQRNISVDGVSVPLTLREYQLLCYLMLHKNLVLTRAQIIGSVWELGYHGDTRTVDTHIKCLRAKLGPYGACIQTLRKVGYRFCWE